MRGDSDGYLEIWGEVDEPTVTVQRFGKDHWSTFLYIDAREKEHQGVLNHDQMRCDSRRHPFFYGAGRQRMAFGGMTEKEYPSRLKTAELDSSGKWGAQELYHHDDYDCLRDLMNRGLVRGVMPDSGGRILTGLTEKQLALQMRFELTPLGHRVADELEAFKAGGGSYHQFMPSDALLAEIPAEGTASQPGPDGQTL